MARCSCWRCDLLLKSRNRSSMLNFHSSCTGAPPSFAPLPFSRLRIGYRFRSCKRLECFLLNDWFSSCCILWSGCLIRLEPGTFPPDLLLIFFLFFLLFLVLFVLIIELRVGLLFILIFFIQVKRYIRIRLTLLPCTMLFGTPESIVKLFILSFE